MTLYEKNISIAKALYLSSNSIKQIANILNLNERTILNYKKNALDKGDDWEMQRVSKYIAAGQKDSKTIYGDFISLMYQQLAEIQESELSTKEKIEAITRLGDSFSKMRKIASHENPEAYTHGIIKLTIQKMITLFKDSIPKECLGIIVEIIENNQEELANVTF
jgi:hypothetical protein